MLEVAKKIGVNGKTAFLWRHRFPIALESHQLSKLSGLVETDETFLLESFRAQSDGMPGPVIPRGTLNRRAVEC